MIKSLWSAFRPRIEIEQTYSPRGQLVINRKNFCDLMVQRRWKNNVDVGKALGYTRQNIAYIMNGQAVSAEFVARIAIITGTDMDKTYSHFFEVARVYQSDNHQRWNGEKYGDRIPYESHSVSAEFRAKDSTVEKKQYKLF